MKQEAELIYMIVLAVIFFTVLATIMVILAYRYYSRRKLNKKTLKQFNEALKQSRLEIREQIFKIIMSEKSGLMGAIESEIRNIEKLGLLQPVFRISGRPVHFDKNKSLIIFRIVQEALHNVLKHAKATLVEMHVCFERDHIKMTIRDNGTGFIRDEFKAGKGLRNMRDRANLIGADFNIDTSVSPGTLIMLTIPQRCVRVSSAATVKTPDALPC